MKNKYYSLKRILEKEADYNIIIGERSNGKTYAVLEKIVTDYVKDGTEGAYIRRWREDIVGKRGDNVFSALVENNVIDKLTGGKYQNVVYIHGKWHLAYYDTELKRFKADRNPFCHAFSLSDMEHDKSTSYPKIRNIAFDEFLTRRYYLPDEFIIFMNVLSTIIRDRDGIKIFMLGNTVNKYCPYFSELGLNNIDNMRQGDIDIYNFANSLKIAVEYCNPTKDSNKKSNKYFSFDNPKLNMIKKGTWEIGIYPHLPMGYKIKNDNILFSFAISFNNNVVGCDIVLQSDSVFIYCRPKTAIKDNDLVYSLDYMPMYNSRKSFLNPIDRIDSKIKMLFATNRVFYQSNDIGEIVHNYLLTCVKS